MTVEDTELKHPLGLPPTVIALSLTIINLIIHFDDSFFSLTTCMTGHDS